MSSEEPRYKCPYREHCGGFKTDDFATAVYHAKFEHPVWPLRIAIKRSDGYYYVRDWLHKGEPLLPGLLKWTIGDNEEIDVDESRNGELKPPTQKTMAISRFFQAFCGKKLNCVSGEL